MQNGKILIAILATVLVFGSAVAVISTADSSDAEDYQEFYAYTLVFKFTGSGAMPEDVTWNFGDGSAEETGYEVKHTFSEKGDYIVKQTAKNVIDGEVNVSTKLNNISIMGDPVVTFNTDGGSVISEKIVPLIKGVPQPVSMPSPDPVKTGYTFTGWYADPACTVEWDFDEGLISKHVTIYAGWFKGVVTSEIPDTEGIREMLDVVKTLDYYVPTTSIDDPTKNLTLTKDLFPLNKDEKITVHFYDPTDATKKPLVTWVIDGRGEFKEDCMENMDLSVESKNGPFTPDQDNAAKKLGATSGYYVDFKASGELPYAMYVTVFVGDQYSKGDTLMLYLYDGGEMVAQYKEAIVDENGYVTTAIDHCSTYAFLSFADMSQGGIDMTTIIVIAIFGVLIAAIIGYRYFVGKKEA